MTTPLNRRRFIKSATAVAATLATTGCLSPLRAERSHYDVIVIGAGLSGLHTTYLLEQQGLNVLLLEASNRVGGRIYTLDHLQGQPEVGGSQIGTGYKVLRDIAARHNLVPEASTSTPAGMAFGINRQLFNAGEWATHAANRLPDNERNTQPNWLMWQYLNKGEIVTDPNDWLNKQYQHLDIPLIDHLKKLGASDEALRLMNSNFSGNDIRTVSALQMLRKNAILKGAGGSEYIRSGMQRLPDAMASDLKNTPVFNKVVATIAQRDNTIHVACTDNSRYSAQRCVMAVPFSTARHMDLQLEISEAKRQAINQLNYSHITHVFLKPKSDYWQEDKFSPNMWTDSPLGMVFGHQDNNGKVILIRAILMGNNARAADPLSKQDIGQLVIKQLAAIRPASKGKLTLEEVVSWHQNPFSQGAIAQFNAGSINRFAHAVALPEGLLHFAGEHTDFRQSGMEAAVISAQRCAQELVAVL